MEKEFLANDMVIPILKFPDPTPVRIKVTDKYIYLYVGQRDWQWDLSDGHLIGSGCCLCSSTEQIQLNVMEAN